MKKNDYKTIQRNKLIALLNKFGIPKVVDVENKSDDSAKGNPGSR